MDVLYEEKEMAFKRGGERENSLHHPENTILRKRATNRLKKRGIKT